MMCKTILIISLFSFAWMQSLHPLNTMPISSRDLSSSGGGGAILSDEITLNPASVWTPQKCMNFHTQSLPSEISLFSLQTIYPTDKTIYFASMTNLNFGTLKDGISNETFLANDIMLKVGLKKKGFNLFSMGGSVSYSFSQIGNKTAQAILISTGVRTEITENQGGFGLTLRNVGFQFDNYESSQEFIPYQLHISGYIKPKHLPSLIFSDIIIEENINGITFISGMEFYLQKGLIMKFSNRGLFQNNYKLSSIAFGFQFNIKNWKIELASQNLISAGITNGITISRPY